ncbi:MAG: hypothetical protein KUA35_02780 [Pseudodesulfovibrio sp.]|uniref:hypothetical protein n=1 Tax=Pseudodesulfovibrio TaxID=2035811 RepID=UPI0001BF927D|nr:MULTISPECIES: hypothetical protein [Pseudodesulfovibrio]MBU4192912.1 hypothetical protein [Pseudomonadota bacterium]MBU4243187.1 hypothetical protein [Pseudomonadota bacterium]MBU4379480.1 hypothetical protein [Pseudomonadota bacterium]MBU4476096.1 hypothetical protein [Pseudomonadota bacterium]MBU4515318.1 hypothetical protein [Pseudomonadota bacterium]
MHIEMIRGVDRGKEGQGECPWQALVRLGQGGTAVDLARAVRKQGLRSLAFDDEALFACHARAMTVCSEMRELDVNVLWSARLSSLPERELLRAMRLAGCQLLDARLGPDEAAEALCRAREFGFDIRLRNVDGSAYATDKTSYTVAEREAIADLLPGLHAAQFDLAVAYYRARRFSDVMQPLGKAMVLRFPMNELCLNLLACLSAARHYPDMAAGLLDQAGHGCPHPVVFRNRGLLRSWMESGGDLRGVRLELEPVSGPGAIL